MTDLKTDMDRLCVDTLRTLSMDAVQAADSGHPGTPMALAPLGYVTWTRHLKHNPANPEWVDRDRFVLSVGHASMLIYGLLYLTGYELTPGTGGSHLGGHGAGRALAGSPLQQAGP